MSSAPEPDADTFGTTGVVTHFRGPYADGPPPEALEVHPPPLERFGPAELGRMVLIGWVIVLGIVRAVASHLVGRRGHSWAPAPSEALVGAFAALGPDCVTH